MTKFNEYFAAYRSEYERAKEIESAARANFVSEFLTMVYGKSEEREYLAKVTDNFTTMWKLESTEDLQEIEKSENYVEHNVLGNAQRNSKVWVKYRFGFITDIDENSPMTIERNLRSSSTYFIELSKDGKSKKASAKSERKYKVTILTEKLENPELSDEERAAIIAEISELLKVR